MSGGGASVSDDGRDGLLPEPGDEGTNGFGGERDRKGGAAEQVGGGVEAYMREIGDWRFPDASDEPAANADRERLHARASSSTVQSRDPGRAASGAEHANGCVDRLPDLRRAGSVGKLQRRREHGVSLGGLAQSWLGPFGHVFGMIKLDADQCRVRRL
jgi:hypothetical protein